MEDVTQLISRVTRELGPDASDEEISEKGLEAIEALPESDRAPMLEELVRGIRSGRLHDLEREADASRQADGGQTIPKSDKAP